MLGISIKLGQNLFIRTYIKGLEHRSTFTIKGIFILYVETLKSFKKMGFYGIKIIKKELINEHVTLKPESQNF